MQNNVTSSNLIFKKQEKKEKVDKGKWINVSTVHRK